MATVYSLAQQTIRLVQFLGLFSEGVKGFRDLMLTMHCYYQITYAF